MDHFVAGVCEFLGSAKGSDGANMHQWRTWVVNTQTSTQEGSHWFTVAIGRHSSQVSPLATSAREVQGPGTFAPAHLPAIAKSKPKAPGKSMEEHSCAEDNPFKTAEVPASKSRPMISPALVVSAAEHAAEGEQGAGAAESESKKQRRGAEEIRTLDAGAEQQAQGDRDAPKRKATSAKSVQSGSGGAAPSEVATLLKPGEARIASFLQSAEGSVERPNARTLASQILAWDALLASGSNSAKRRQLAV